MLPLHKLVGIMLLFVACSCKMKNKAQNDDTTIPKDIADPYEQLTEVKKMALNQQLDSLDLATDSLQLIEIVVDSGK